MCVRRIIKGRRQNSSLGNNKILQTFSNLINNRPINPIPCLATCGRVGKESPAFITDVFMIHDSNKCVTSIIFGVFFYKNIILIYAPGGASGQGPFYL